MSKSYGFARCSLGEEKGQDLNRQIRELKAVRCPDVFEGYPNLKYVINESQVEIAALECFDRIELTKN